MKASRFLLAGTVLAASLIGAGNLFSGESDKITLPVLLDRVASLDWLYTAPLAGEKQLQFSSYDRKSKIENGQKIDWYANMDAGNYLAEESKDGGKEYVMADYQGAGYIARIWSANPGKDRWRVYLDGSDTPVIDEPGAELLSGKGKYFKEPFAGKRAMGQVLIFPLPFQKSCKVCLYTISPVKPIRYFQVDIITAPEGTVAETFKLDDLQKYSAQVKAASDILTKRAPLVPAGLAETKFELELAPNAEKKLADIAGPGVIKTVEVSIKQSSLEDARVALNEAVLTGKFDGIAMPFILAPLGAFFGSAPGVESYKSLGSGISWDKPNKTATLLSYWPMPLKKSASFSLANHSNKPLKISGKILLEQKAVGDALYFHASYNYLNYHATRPFSDWTLLNASGGAGRYVGTMLSVRNPDYMWWGEGDEKVSVDNETFPSIFGTGTEDYFSYAWGTDYKRFDHAYYGIPLAARRGRTLMLAPYQLTPYRLLMTNPREEEMVSQYRWHILDQIPFHQGLNFNLEVWHWTPVITFDLQAMSYWYGQAAVSYDQQAIIPEEIPNW